MLKSQSGDGARFDDLLFIGDSLTPAELGSSGMTAKRPRCKHGEAGP